MRYYFSENIYPFNLMNGKREDLVAFLLDQLKCDDDQLRLSSIQLLFDMYQVHHSCVSKCTYNYNNKLYVCMCVCMYIHVCMHVHVCMFVCMYVCNTMYVCMFVCMFVCMYVCACMCNML